MNVDLDSGSFTAIGQDVTLFAGRQIDLTNGSFTITCRDVAFTVEINIQLDTASYTYAGYDIRSAGWLEPFVCSGKHRG